MRVVVFRVGLASLLAVASVDWALAQASQVTLPEVAVTGRRPNEVRPVRRSREAVPARAQPRPTSQPSPADTPSGAQPAATPWGGPPGNAASEKVFSGATVNAFPALRPGEVLETVPGLIVTQHSGEGKANQYFLRGFNLDHGTDLAIWVAGMPVNMRTHGHGQGYADISFLIPELIRSMTVRKGPYYAEEGDFSSAGAVHIDYVDRLDKNLLQTTFGSFGYRRGLAAASMPIQPGNLLAGSLLVAGEVYNYDGPWQVPDQVRKFNGVARYSQGTLDDGVSLTGMGYVNRWTSTDQIAARAVTSGLIDRFGTLDPTDGGQSSRFSLSGRWSQSDKDSASRVDAYAIRSTLALFNNFTYFLDDPVNGDQFSQTDKRTILGFNASHMLRGHLGGFETETKFGVQSRYDDIQVGLAKTLQRNTLSTVREDAVQEGSIGVYGQHTTHLTDWLRSIVGLRGDWFAARDRSDTPENSGNVEGFIASPKFGLVFGPFAKTEFFLNAGTGFHSNDVRGTVITVDPNDKVTPAQRVPLLVRSKGAEVGVRTQAIPGLDSSVALFVLDFASELLFVGDAGTTEASRPSRRVGVEWTNHYQPLPWLGFDLDFAFTRARFTDSDPVGNYIPGAPAMIASAGIVLGRDIGWFGAAKLRYFGARPLVEDDSVRSRATTLVNARLGYKFETGARVQLDAFNLFNAKADQIDYYYTSRLPGEPDDGVADHHFHPVEPLAVRLTFATPF
jgi:outer membrane receptor protein involved in Fe transport